jgi:hypothetical protein
MRRRTHSAPRGLLLGTATHCEIEPNWLAFEFVREQGGCVDIEAARLSLHRYFAIRIFGGLSILDVNERYRLPPYPAEIKELASRGARH